MTVAYQKTRDANHITAIFLSILIASVLFSVLFLAYPIHLFVDSAVPMHYIAMIFLALGCYTYYSNRLAMFRLYKSINAISLLESPLLIASFFTLHYFGMDILESLIFAVISQNIIMSLYIKIANKAVLKEPSLKNLVFDTHTKEYLKNSAMSSAEFVFGITFIYLGIFCTKLYFGLHELALYQVVIKPIFMYGIMLFVFPVVKFIFPELSVLVPNQEWSEITKLKEWLSKYALLATLTLSIGIFMIGGSGIELLFGEQYKDALVPLIIILLALYFAVMNAFYISLLKANGRFLHSLLVRSSSVVFFCFIFFLLQSIKSNFINITIAIAASYACVNLLSILILKSRSAS